MKIDRLIGILSILLQQEKVTAPYLAEKFEVSRRTINRDIEDICKAGIPIVTSQGQNGGISIMEGYRMDKTLLTSSDMQAILAGLKSLDSVSGSKRYQQLMEKLAMGNSSVLASNNHIMIDLASWYRTSLAPKISVLQAAVEDRRKVEFNYYAPGGESSRSIEPYLLIFKWSSWYLWGYCCEKQDYRLFKLNRMTDLKATEEQYEPRQIPVPDLSAERVYPLGIDVEAVFEPDMKWRLVEEFGMESFVEQEDGRLKFSFGFADKENLFGWLLSFGDRVELTKPVELRRELYEMMGRLQKMYRE
ncbi:helix-turn-helix transcriptional regulator [Clostridium transplantifaecale]|uniref:helix-turn-helix transcriptional regulator n=1 Tax=Clostridium transplantifaecale TaxID=2479838 RepID=UPI000F638B0D|nr:YafY family protein [Clostridium transplantifaecale]